MNTPDRSAAAAQYWAPLKEIAGAVIRLCSDAAAFVTGHTLMIDGDCSGDDAARAQLTADAQGMLLSSRPDTLNRSCEFTRAVLILDASAPTRGIQIRKPDRFLR